MLWFVVSFIGGLLIFDKDINIFTKIILLVFVILSLYQIYLGLILIWVLTGQNNYGKINTQ